MYHHPTGHYQFWCKNRLGSYLARAPLDREPHLIPDVQLEEDIAIYTAQTMKSTLFAMPKGYIPVWTIQGYSEWRSRVSNRTISPRRRKRGVRRQRFMPLSTGSPATTKRRCKNRLRRRSIFRLSSPEPHGSTRTFPRSPVSSADIEWSKSRTSSCSRFVTWTSWWMN